MSLLISADIPLSCVSHLRHLAYTDTTLRNYEKDIET